MTPDTLATVAVLAGALYIGYLLFNSKARAQALTEERRRVSKEWEDLILEAKTGAKDDIEAYRKRRDEYRNRYNNVVIQDDGDDDGQRSH